MSFETPIGIIELGDINIKCVIFKINNNNDSEILSTTVTNSEGIRNDVVTNLETQVSKYEAADIEKNRGKKVCGALYNISKADERRLDFYEEYPTMYKKIFFKYYNKNFMTYTMVIKTRRVSPTLRYLNVIKQGYKDCKLNMRSLNAALLPIKHLPRK